MSAGRAAGVPAVIHRPLTVEEAAERRRSIRRYRPEAVPPEDLARILHVASLAPSAFNLQPWRFAVVQDHDLKARIVAEARGQRQVASAPAVVVLYTDVAEAIATLDEVLVPQVSPERRASVHASVARQFGRVTEDEREAWGESQGYITLGFLLLAAESLGYQTSPMLGFDATAVKALLDLPAHVRVPALVAIGRGDETGAPHHRHHLERIVRTY